MREGIEQIAFWACCGAPVIEGHRADCEYAKPDDSWWPLIRRALFDLFRLAILCVAFCGAFAILQLIIDGRVRWH